MNLTPIRAWEKIAEPTNKKKSEKYIKLKIKKGRDKERREWV